MFVCFCWEYHMHWATVTDLQRHQELSWSPQLSTDLSSTFCQLERGKERERTEKGAELEMKEYYFKQFSADNSQSGTTNSGGFDTKANSQIWSVTSGSDLRTWWLLGRYLKTGWYEMHTHKHAQSGGLDFIQKTTSVKLGTTGHISQGHS